jgi:spore germination cell wall hydrolase CwlJ-like protein
VPPETLKFATSLNPDQIAALGIVAEASPDPQEMLAVGHVLLNRLKRPERYGNSLYEVLLGGEFDAFRNQPDKLTALMDSDRFQAAMKLVQAIKSGEAPDPTGGATHFLAPELMASEGYTTPSWADPSKGVQFGKTVFFPDPG